jgi:hypothetical protein
VKTLLGLGRSFGRRIRHRVHDSRSDAKLLLGRCTSIADARGFPARSAEAAADPGTFATFKQDAEFRVVVENLSCEHGRRYLETALEQAPFLADDLNRFRENDRLGTPKTCSYGAYGDFAPTTLRYVKVLSDLVSLFGSLREAHIIEIGGGYGGQCYITSIGTQPASYTLVDLDPVLELQRVYLQHLAVPKVQFVSARDLNSASQYDLVVSNYAFSECVRRVQRYYIDRVLRRSLRGYITCNWFRGRLISLSRGELLAAVPGSRYVPDQPVVNPKTSILIWGDAQRVRTNRPST